MNGQNLHQAHQQWSSRPADERFSTIEDLHQNAAHAQFEAKELGLKWENAQIGVKIGENGEELALGSKTSSTGIPLSNWAVRQVCLRAEAPSGYIATLPADLAAECINHGLIGAQGESRVLVGRDASGNRLVRGMTSDRYTRIWDGEVVERVMEMPGNWSLPMAYKNDGNGWNIQHDANRNPIMVPSGAYRSDRDMFLFMVDESRRIEDGTKDGLARGFMVWNSEVGAKAFGIKTFLYRHVCGNHIVWGAENVATVKLRHVGNADSKAFAELALALGEYANSSAETDEAQIRAAQGILLGDDEEKTVETVVKVVQTLPRKAVSASYQLAKQFAEVDGSPNTLWGMTQGITRYAQLSKWTDERVDVDAAAGQLMVRVLGA